MEPTVVARRVRFSLKVERNTLCKIARAFQFYVRATRNRCIDIFRITSNLDSEVLANLVNEACRLKSGAPGWTHECDLVAGSRTRVSQITETILKLLPSICGEAIVKQLLGSLGVFGFDGSGRVAELDVHGAIISLGGTNGQRANGEE